MWLLPCTFRLALLSGLSTVSSWSWPNVVWPLRWRTPITPKGTFLIRITWPSGSLSPKRLPATVCPMSATLAAPSISSWLKRRPSATSHSRAEKNSPVTPWTLVAQFRLAYTIWALPRGVGAAAATVQISLDGQASSVMVGWLPELMHTPPRGDQAQAR